MPPGLHEVSIGLMEPYGLRFTITSYLIKQNIIAIFSAPMKESWRKWITLQKYVFITYYYYYYYQSSKNLLFIKTSAFIFSPILDECIMPVY